MKSLLKKIKLWFRRGSTSICGTLQTGGFSRAATLTLQTGGLLCGLALCFASLSLTSCTNTLSQEIKVQPSVWSQGSVETPVYLMASIGYDSSTESNNKTISNNNLHLAYSTDGLTFTALNSNNSVFTCGIGSEHIRDPYIFRLNDGTFVLLAADFTQAGNYWDLGSRSDLNYYSHPSNKIYVSFSEDLITWTGGHLLQLTNGSGTSGATRHCWSPRAVYNEEDKCYDIYWVGDNYSGDNLVYLTQTYDFLSVKSLSDNVIYNPAYSVTWATIVKDSGKYYLFARDESVVFGTSKGGDIQMASSTKWGRTFYRTSKYYINRLSDQDSPILVQYPCVYKLSDSRWVLLVNQTNSLGTFNTFVTEDISNPESWVSASDSSLSFSFPSVCDVSITKITQEELSTLQEAF